MKKKFLLGGVLVAILLTGSVIAVLTGTRERFTRVEAAEERFVLRDIGLYDTENYRVLCNGKGKYRIDVQKNGKWVEWKGKTKRMEMMEEMEKALNGVNPTTRPPK